MPSDRDLGSNRGQRVGKADSPETIEIFGPVDSFKQIIDSLQSAGIQPEESEHRMIPNQEIELDPDEAVQVLRVLESLDELDDVQTVYSNLNISDEALAKLEPV